jgi:uncharacterized protein
VPAGSFAVNDTFAQPQPGPHAPPRSGPVIDPDAPPTERTFALWTHLAGLLSIATASVPLIGLVATLILWRARAEESPFLDDHGREATNFQISLGIYWVAGTVLAGVLAVISFGLLAPLIAAGAVIGPIAMTILTGIGCVRGSIAANKGEYYRYPMCVRLVKPRPSL